MVGRSRNKVLREARETRSREAPDRESKGRPSESQVIGARVPVSVVEGREASVHLGGVGLHESFVGGPSFLRDVIGQHGTFFGGSSFLIVPVDVNLFKSYLFVSLESVGSVDGVGNALPVRLECVWPFCGEVISVSCC